MPQTQGQTKEIDGNTYTMFMLSPMRSHDLLMDVVKMIGPGLGPLLDASISSGGVNLEQQLDAKFFSRAASALFSGIDKSIVKHVIDEFSKVTQVQGDSGTLDKYLEAHFLGRLSSMYKWIAWGMGVQWGGLVGALSGAMQAQSATLTALSQSESPTGSTG